ncbi:unnamed protein product [Durusdinium trenchii]|uniref:Reverse transcriptase domain-containing protein n=1 Tax=Durusdinium trenchii TaxID=1381693 RepID=A0ABP0HMB6_9DINO
MPRAVISEAEGNKALEAAGTDIKYLLSRHEVSVDNQKLFFHHGVTTIEKLSNFAKDRDDLAAVLKEHWELDSDRSLEERVQVAAITCAFSNAKTRSQRAAEVDAEYDTLQWSRPVVAGEWAAMRSALEKRYGHLEDKIYPPKEFVEKKLAEVESGEYRAEELTEVVSKEEIEPDGVVPIWDSKGRLAMRKASTKVQEPANAEELRRRLTIWKNAMVMISLKHSNRHELQGAWEETVEQYKDYLLGDYVYGLSAKDAEGQTFAAPPWKLVIAYERAIRKQAVKLTNTEGKPLTVALKMAWKDATVKERNFTTPLALYAKRPTPPWREQPVQKWAATEKGAKGKDKGKGKKGRGMGGRHLKVLYIFSGRKRRNSVAWYLRELALRKGVQVEITELDIQSDRRSDFTIPAVQKKWLQLIAQGIYYAVIVTPPCSTFSRAVWANDLGPFPLRSSTYPRGFPWNRADRFHKAEFGTILADFSFEALKRQFACGRRIGLMEQPEDLGRTNYERIPGHQPASMWQFWQFRQLLELPDIQTVVFAQSDFGTESPKPTRWPPERRMKLEGREWVMVRHHILLAAVKRLGSVAEVEKEASRMARGGDSFQLVREEAFLQEIRDILAEKLDIPRQERPEEGQPFFLDTMKGVLQRAGDPDWEFLEQAKTGLPLGILHEMPRTPAVFEEQVKWSLEGDGWGSAVWQKDNYASAAEHEKYLVEHLEQEVAEGLMVKMSEEDFVRTYGKNRAVAALAVLVEDELTGKKRVIHDGTHGVMVNHRIKCRDKVRMPGPREKRTLLEEYGADRAAVLSLVGDFAKAHRRFKYLKEEHGFLACKAATRSSTVYVNQVGTFGIASTPYWWARLSAALMRLVYWVLGGDFPNDMLLYADDLEVLAIGRQGRIGGVLAYAVMAALGAPFKWAKQRGGLVTEWIGLTTDYQSFSMGLSVKRTGWVLEWIASLRRRKEVTYREFAAGLGRLGFSALALPWERPLLGPLYAWASAIQMNRGAMTIPWAIQFILDWIAKRSQRLAPPWLYYRGKNPKRVIAALELLATLVALKLWLKSAGDSAEVCAEAFTDNRGNAFILKKGLSTKYPVTLLVIEVAETLRRCDAFATLTWVRRDGNELADALTNEDFSAFDHQRREAVEEGGLQWHVMDELLRGSEVLFNEIKEHKKEETG